MLQIAQKGTTTTLPAGSAAATRRTRSVVATAAKSNQETPPAAARQAAGRRGLLMAAALAAAPALLPFGRPARADGQGVEVVSEEAGSGTAAAQLGDLVLVHYVGTTAAGQLFDSTRGGAMYRDGGNGVLRPAIIRLGGPPVPGICQGLQLGIVGMRVGGRRTFAVPAVLGFGSQTVLGPYGIVEGGSTVQYEVELLRLSRRGPDALMTGIAQCGAGFANERTAGCADIQPAEFV